MPRSFERDVRFALAALLRQPGFTLVVVATLALGIGANTALFSVADAVLFRPLPYPEPDRVVALWETTPNKARVTAANFLDWRDQARSFESMAAFGAAGFTLTGSGSGEPERLDGATVTAAYFDVLGVTPELGRAFVSLDEDPAASSVILSHELWQRRFGGDPSVIGASLLLDGVPRTVVGVVPPGIYPTWPVASGRFSVRPKSQQFFVPLVFDARRAANRNSHVFGVVGRLRSGVEVENARADLNAIANRLAHAYPATNEGEGILMSSIESEILGDVRPALTLLLGAVGLVLVLACANVASVLLARGASREREIAVRRALGASRGRIASLLLTESLVLSLLGGVAGCLLATLLVNALVSVLPADLPRLGDVALNGRVLAFALFASVATGIGFGLGPALQASATDAGRGLRDGRSGSDNIRGQRLRRGLVVVQVALALVLLTSGSLLARSFDQLQRVDPGFEPDGVLVFDLVLPPRYRSMTEVTTAYTELLDRLRGLPSVKAAALAYDSPLESNWIDGFGIEGRPAPEEGRAARLAIVGPGYFDALEVTLRAGRPLDERDSARSPGAVVISNAFAERFFPGENPLGHWLTLSSPTYTWGAEATARFQIVGVAEDVHSSGIASSPEPTYYVPAGQFPQRDMSVVLRVAGDPLKMTPAVRREVARFDSSLAVANPTTLKAAIASSVAQPRFNMLVLVGFSALALTLAVVGLYGLLAYSVARRQREIGVRLALGARPEQVTRLVVGEGLRLIAIGSGVGVLGAIAAGRVIASLLFGVEPSDGISFATAALLLLSTGLAASYLPARRASGVAPASALRAD